MNNQSGALTAFDSTLDLTKTDQFPPLVDWSVLEGLVVDPVDYGHSHGGIVPRKYMIDNDNRINHY